MFSFMTKNKNNYLMNVLNAIKAENFHFYTTYV